MMSREQNRAWAMTMAVAAILMCGGCAEDTTSSSTASVQSTVTSDVTTDTDNKTTASETASDAVTATPLSNVRVEYDEDDYTSTYDTFDAEITLKDDTATVTGSTNAVQVADHVVTIQNGGTYRITGTWDNGQLRVTGSEKVKLYFDGVSITNPSGAALYCENEKRTILSLAANTTNTLSDGSDAVSTEEQEAAALYTKDKLTINGSGTLNIQGVAANGIVCRDDLKIIDGTIQVTAANNGIKGKDSIAICGGTITIDAQNDGLKTTESEDSERGWIVISDGTINITAKGDGIQAETDCYLDGGILNVTTTGEITTSSNDEMQFGGGQGGGDPFDGQTPPDIGDGSNPPDDNGNGNGMTPPDDNGNGNGMTPPDNNGDGNGMTPPDNNGNGNGGNGGTPPDAPSGQQPEQNQNQNQDTMTTTAAGTTSEQTQTTVTTVTMETAATNTTNATNTTAETTTEDTTAAEDNSSKGIKAGNCLTITDGTITISSTDHCMHSKGAFTCSGGTLTLNSSSAKGISSHGDLQITDGTITIEQATEGIESKADMTLAGGTIRILQASDDGLNTGGGTGMGMGGDFQMQKPEDNTTDSTTATTTAPVTSEETVTTTTTTEAESHDMTISGGTIYINADGDGIDSNGAITMTGGTVFVSGPTSGGDGAIDYETDMTMSGGQILALSSRGMMEYPSTQHYCTTNISASAGDFIAVCDADGNILMGMQTQKAVSDVVYYGDQMENCQLIVGGTYTGTDVLSDDGTTTSGTVSGGTTATDFVLTDRSEHSDSGFSQGGGQGGGFGGKDDNKFEDFQKEDATVTTTVSTI